MKTIRKTAMAVTSAALIMGLTACGSGTKSSEGKGSSNRSGDATGKRADAPTVLKAALEKMAQQNSYRTVETGKTGSEPESRAEMTFQNEPEATETKTFGGKSKGAASGGTHILSVGGVLYLATSDVPGKSWYTMEDLDSARSRRRRPRGSPGKSRRRTPSGVSREP